MATNTVEILQQTYTVEVNNLAIPSASGTSASNVSLSPTGSVTVTNVQAAIAQLAKKTILTRFRTYRCRSRDSLV